MSIFDSLGSAQREPNARPTHAQQTRALGNTRSNARFMPTEQEAQQLRDARQKFNADPVGALRGCGLNIPDGMSDPRQIAMHLFQSGQIGQNGRMVRR